MDKKKLTRDELRELAMIDLAKEYTPTEKAFYKSPEWVELSSQYRERHPFCELCLQEETRIPSAEVHHIVPISKGGEPLDENNLIVLCKSCHSDLHGSGGISINLQTLESVPSEEDDYEFEEIDDLFDSIEDWDEFERQVGEAGKYKSKHFSEYYHQVEQLKSAKKHDEAIGLLLELVAAEEQEAEVSRRGVGGYSYRQLAIIYRKEKRFDKEVEILERYAKQHQAPGVAQRDLAERLVKAKELRDKHRF